MLFLKLSMSNQTNTLRIKTPTNKKEMKFILNNTSCVDSLLAKFCDCVCLDIDNNHYCSLLFKM